MNPTILKRSRTIENQKTAIFTGDGAYHGSSHKYNEKPLVASEKKTFPEFLAYFDNNYEIKSRISAPTQEEIQDDEVTFVWCPFEEALKEAGPETKRVLQEMQLYLVGDRKYIYIDSKIQYFQKGDTPVDNKLWHVDGSVGIRDERATSAGYSLLHDMKSILEGNNRYLAYQSSTHCATEFLTYASAFMMPEFIPSFDVLDDVIERDNPSFTRQPAGSIVAFDNRSIHRAVPATSDGWRLWIRCMETDREVNLTSSMIECYGTVFKRYS